MLIRATRRGLAGAGVLLVAVLAGATAAHALDPPDYTCHISGRLSQYGKVTRENPYVPGDTRKWRAYYLTAGGSCVSNDPKGVSGYASLSGSLVEYGFCVTATANCAPGVFVFGFLSDYGLEDNYLTTPSGTRPVWLELLPEPVNQWDTNIVHPATQGVMRLHLWHAGEECTPPAPLAFCIPKGNGVLGFVYDDPLRPEPFDGGDITIEGTLEVEV